MCQGSPLWLAVYRCNDGSYGLIHCRQSLAAAQARFPQGQAGLRGATAIAIFIVCSGNKDVTFNFRSAGMAELKADVLVLGAGMVGVGAALHLQQRGRDVILVDRDGQAGEGTSFGNAGIIEVASVFPYMFPRDFGQILRYALNRTPQMRYSIADLPVFLPWLLRYYLASSPERALQPDRA
jgi:hypothetical protein